MSGDVSCPRRARESGSLPIGVPPFRETARALPAAQVSRRSEHISTFTRYAPARPVSRHSATDAGTKFALSGRKPGPVSPEARSAGREHLGPGAYCGPAPPSRPTNGSWTHTARQLGKVELDITLGSAIDSPPPGLYDAAPAKDSIAIGASAGCRFSSANPLTLAEMRLTKERTLPGPGWYNMTSFTRKGFHGRFVSQARGPAPPAARPTRRLTVPRARTGRKLGRRGREGEMVTKNAVRVLGYYGRRSRKGGRPKVLSLLYTLAGGNHDRAGAAFSWRGGPLGFL